MEPAGEVLRLNTVTTQPGTTAQTSSDARRTRRRRIRAEVDKVLADLDGVLTTPQALTCGLSRGQISRKVKNGSWEHYARGVYLSRQHAFTDAALVRAVVGAHRGVADRTSAAWWHGMIDALRRSLTVCVPVNSHRPPELPHEVVLLHRSLPAEDLTEERGLPVTAPALTVLGTLATLEKDASAFLDRVLQRKLVTVADLTAALERNKGMHGLRPARDLLATLVAGAESEAERLFAELLKLHEITGWIQQYRFGGRPIDFAWPAERVSVEINGWAYHRDAERFENDNAKTAMLAAAGWITLSFTWKQLTDDPERCIAQVAAALAMRR